MKTRNEELLRKVQQTTDMLDYYKYKATQLIHQLNSIELTRTEKEIWGKKEEIIENLETYYIY